MAIRMLQDAAERGEIDPWDVDVIAVIDGFLDKLHQRISAPSLALAQGTRFEQDLAESSEAFLAASVLVGLKAELLERTNFPPPEADESFFADQVELESDHDLQILLPLRPERQLLRRPVAPPPLQRPVSLGELIRQLEEIAERLEQDERRPRQRGNRRFSERMAIAQVAALAHREKLPETTAALNAFIQSACPVVSEFPREGGTAAAGWPVRTPELATPLGRGWGHGRRGPWRGVSFPAGSGSVGGLRKAVK
jgi:segregation and condensation protein A